jgi:predicted ATPase/DNA-binding SARP family transcriptional activator
VEFGILGSLEARDGDRLISLARPKQRAVLAVLLIEAGRVVSIDRLIDLLWDGEAPTWATGALHVHISGLRAALEPDRPARTRTSLLVTQSPGYRLQVEPEQIDACRFEALAARGRDLLSAGCPAEAREALLEGLALWRGPALAEFARETFAWAEAARLEELRSAAIEDRIQADLALGRAAAAAAELEVLVAERPLRERLWALLMMALYRSERQSEALRAFSRARTILREELGIEPGPSLRRLEEDILRHAPTLDWRPPPRPESHHSSASAPAPAAGPSGPAARLPVRVPLVGRAHEVRALEGLVAAAADGRGSVVLVSGEPGIGKTRLVEELVATAAQTGVAVAWGRCHEGPGAPSFWPWVQVIRGALSTYSADGGDDVRHGLVPFAGEIAQIAPEVKEFVATFEPPPVLDAPNARFRLYEAVSGFVGALCARRPLAIVLDDIHWADVPSLQLLEFVAARVAETGVLVVATFRDVDPTVGGPLADTLGVLARLPSLHRMPLAGLTSDECAAFIAQMLRAEPSPAVASTVHERTDGNPFFVGELARLLASEGELATSTDVHTHVPAGVRDVIRRRLGRLPAKTNELLAAAAVLGRDVDLELLGAAGRIDRDEAVELLDAAVAVGILTDDPGVPGRYKFFHALVQETILEEIGLARQAKLHARAAGALRSLYGSDPAHAVELAHHLYAATPIVRVEEALAAALEAADVSQRRLAYEQAEAMLHQGLELVGRMEESPERWQRELEVQHRLATLLSHTEGYHSVRVAQAWGRARDLCIRLGNRPEVLASMWGLARATRSRAEFATCIELGRHLLDLSRSSPDASFAIAGHECCGFPALFQGHLGEARAHLSEAVELSDQALLETADAGSMVLYPGITCRAYLAIVQWLLGDDADARALTEAACRMADESEHALSEAIALLYGAKLASMRGEADVTELLCQRTLRLAEVTPLGALEAVAGVLDGWARGVQGDHEVGLAQLARSVSSLRTTGWRLALTYFHALQADIERAAGLTERALASVEAGLRIAAATGEHYYDAELCRLAGVIVKDRDRAAAANWFQRAARVAEGQGAVAWQRLTAASVEATGRG